MINVLLLCDDFWHPGEVMERGLRPLENKDVIFDTVKAPKDILTREMLSQYDVIVCARGGAHSAANAQNPWFETGVTAVMPEQFEEYVKNGGGFLALHAGNTFRRDRGLGLSELIGNDFCGHPKQCLVKAETVGSHPITANIEPFSFVDEHYCIDVHAKDAEIILKTTSDSEAGTQTAGYVRIIGKGRVCCLTPGHNCAVLRQPMYLQMIYNALAWCAKKI